MARFLLLSIGEYQPPTRKRKIVHLWQSRRISCLWAADSQSVFAFCSAQSHDIATPSAVSTSRAVMSKWRLGQNEERSGGSKSNGIRYGTTGPARQDAQQEHNKIMERFSVGGWSSGGTCNLASAQIITGRWLSVNRNLHVLLSSSCIICADPCSVLSRISCCHFMVLGSFMTERAIDVSYLRNLTGSITG